MDAQHYPRSNKLECLVGGIQATDFFFFLNSASDSGVQPKSGNLYKQKHLSVSFQELGKYRTLVVNMVIIPVFLCQAALTEASHVPLHPDSHLAPGEAAQLGQ